VEQGGRLIITSTQTSFSGAGDEEERESDETDCEPDDQEQAVEKDKKEAEEKSAEQAETSEENKEAVDDEPVPPPWAVQTKSFDKEKKKKDNKGSTATGILGGTKIRLIWPNNVVFKELDEHWQILLRLNDEPVLIQRKLGQGNIVLATSSFFLSNEAMLRDRQVALLAWLTGNPSRLTFDEFHHGLRSQESIAGMIRSHNLHGVIIILLLLAFLFVWKNSSSLLPRSGSQEKTTHQRIGRDQFEGMVNTLRLNPPENLVVTALQQWAKSNRKWCQAHPEQLRKMHQAALEDPQQAEKTKNTSRETQQVACYQAISRILHENKNKPPHHQQENL
jgi:hypothetical protein